MTLCSTSRASGQLSTNSTVLWKAKRHAGVYTRPGSAGGLCLSFCEQNDSVLHWVHALARCTLGLQLLAVQQHMSCSRARGLVIALPCSNMHGRCDALP
jgi:hypothetical protein